MRFVLCVLRYAPALPLVTAENCVDVWYLFRFLLLVVRLSPTPPALAPRVRVQVRSMGGIAAASGGKVRKSRPRAQEAAFYHGAQIPD